MKTIILIFSLAFVFFTANSAPTLAPVLDLDRKYLRTGADYYVMPPDLDGGLFPANFENKPCPAGVAQFQNVGTGLALTFTPVNPKKGVIRVSTDVNIKFTESTGCNNETSVWKVKYDKSMKQYAVMVGGVEGNPGPETLDNWFKIEKTNDGYKFVFCPSVCSYCKQVMCRDVGIAVDESGAQRLVLTSDPSPFIFFPIP